MSVFTNPTGGAREAADACIAALLDLLGDRDPLRVQHELMAETDRLIAGLSDEDLRRPEAPGKWSILQVLEHLADQELVSAYRLRAITAEHEPPLPGYDQDAWARGLRYGTTGPAEVLALLRALRRRNLALYDSLGPAEFERVGIHAERGRESAHRLCRLMGAHDLVHRRQIARIRAAIGRPVA
jgi:hypothetical protein